MSDKAVSEQKREIKNLLPMESQGVRVYFDSLQGGFSLADCPSPEILASFIALACNNHYKLVEALEAIQQRANESGTGEMGLIGTINDIHAIVVQALAEVKS